MQVILDVLQELQKLNSKCSAFSAGKSSHLKEMYLLLGREVLTFVSNGFVL